MTVAGPAVRRHPAARIAVVIGFLVPLMWQVLGAVSNLRVWIEFATLLGRQLSAFAWIVLLVGLAVPVVAFVAGLAVGRGRPAGSLALILLLALCTSQAVTLSQLAFFQAGIGAL